MKAIEWFLKDDRRDSEVLTSRECGLCNYNVVCSFDVLFRTFINLKAVVWEKGCPGDVITKALEEELREKQEASSAKETSAISPAI